MRYWLIKSNPKCFSIDDLKVMQTDMWEGVRNYRARNFMRDEMQVGDQIFFYHSSANPSGIAGIMRVSKAAYPDPTQFHPDSRHYDPAAFTDKPRWYAIDVTFEQRFADILPLAHLKTLFELEDSLLLRKGCEQLTILPLEPKHWQAIMDALEDKGLIGNIESHV